MRMRSPLVTDVFQDIFPIGSRFSDNAPKRPTVPKPNWKAGAIATDDVQQSIEHFESIWQQQWQDIEYIMSYSKASGDFIYDSVESNTSSIDPALGEYDVVYCLEWDDEEYPVFDVDDVDLEIFTV